MIHIPIPTILHVSDLEGGSIRLNAEHAFCRVSCLREECQEDPNTTLAVFPGRISRFKASLIAGALDWFVRKVSSIKWVVRLEPFVFRSCLKGSRPLFLLALPRKVLKWIGNYSEAIIV